GLTPDNVAERVLTQTAAPPSHGHGHVFTLHAELEGMLLSPVLEALIAGWQAQGYDVTSMRRLCETVQPLALPRHEVAPGTVPGRSGTLLVQGQEFLGDVSVTAAA